MHELAAIRLRDAVIPAADSREVSLDGKSLHFASLSPSAFACVAHRKHPLLGDESPSQFPQQMQGYSRQYVTPISIRSEAVFFVSALRLLPERTHAKSHMASTRSHHVRKNTTLRRPFRISSTI